MPVPGPHEVGEAHTFLPRRSRRASHSARGEDLAGRRMHGRCAVSGRPGTCTGLPAQVSDGVIVR
jgi:hypothetical protein